MMKVRSGLGLVLIFTACGCQSRALNASGERLLPGRDAPSVLAELHKALRRWRTLRADITLEIGSLDKESSTTREGVIKICRPHGLRFQLNVPGGEEPEAIAVLRDRDLWLYSPLREVVLCLDLGRGLPDGGILPWLPRAYADDAAKNERWSLVPGTDADRDAAEAFLVGFHRPRYAGGSWADVLRPGGQVEWRHAEKSYHLQYGAENEGVQPSARKLEVWVDEVSGWPSRIARRDHDDEYELVTFSNMVVDSPLQIRDLSLVAPVGTVFIRVNAMPKAVLPMFEHVLASLASSAAPFESAQALGGTPLAP
jgi:outer membrane lipoprotein-sorting protein